MARIRGLKPAFWHDRKLARSTSRDARMLYMGLWNYADEHGRANADPRLVKGEVFPFDDDLTPDDIERLIKELAEAGRILLYDVDGDPYMYLPTLSRHQRLEPHKVDSQHPSPPPVDDPQQALPMLDQPSEQPVWAPPGSDPDESAQDPSAAQASARYTGNREQGTGTTRGTRAAQTDDGFADFWAKYPRHKGKDAARKAWTSARKRASAEQILAGLARYTFHPDAQFIPYPATWLNQGRWEDEPDRPSTPTPVGAGAGRQPWQL